MHWILMLLFSKKILNEYKALVVKMVDNSVTVDITKTKYELLCNLETLLGLFYIIPVLELV
jgi:hypothetical protein